MTCALLLAFLIFINIFVSLPSYTYKWTESGSLDGGISGSTKDLLSKLTERPSCTSSCRPATCSTTMSATSRTTSGPTSKPRSPRSTLTPTPREYLKGPTLPRALARGPGLRVGRGVLIVYGAMPADLKVTVPHQFIPEDKPEEFKPPRQKIVKVESEITKERRPFPREAGPDAEDLSSRATARSTSRKPSPTPARAPAHFSKVGGSLLVEKLKKDNYEVQPISFGAVPADAGPDVQYLGSIAGDKQIEILEDCTTLIVSGSQHRAAAQGPRRDGTLHGPRHRRAG